MFSFLSTRLIRFPLRVGLMGSIWTKHMMDHSKRETYDEFCHSAIQVL